MYTLEQAQLIDGFLEKEYRYLLERRSKLQHANDNPTPNLNARLRSIRMLSRELKYSTDAEFSSFADNLTADEF